MITVIAVLAVAALYASVLVSFGRKADREVIAQRFAAYRSSSAPEPAIPSSPTSNTSNRVGS